MLLQRSRKWFYTRDLRLCLDKDAFHWTGSVSGHNGKQTFGLFTGPAFREDETFVDILFRQQCLNINAISVEKALPDVKVLWPTRLTRCRPSNLAEGRTCGRLRRVRLRGASHLMVMDGGCGAQRPLWRASTSGSTASGDSVRHSGHGCRQKGPPPPPRSDLSGPPPPPSTATSTTDRRPPPTRRGGGPQLAAHDGRAVAAAHRGTH